MQSRCFSVISFLQNFEPILRSVPILPWTQKRDKFQIAQIVHARQNLDSDSRFISSFGLSWNRGSWSLNWIPYFCKKKKWSTYIVKYLVCSKISTILRSVCICWFHETGLAYEEKLLSKFWVQSDLWGAVETLFLRTQWFKDWAVHTN